MLTGPNVMGRSSQGIGLSKGLPHQNEYNAKYYSQQTISGAQVSPLSNVLVFSDLFEQYESLNSP